MDDLPDAVVAHTRELRTVINAITRHHNTLRRLQHRMLEIGFDHEGREIEAVADSIDLAISQLSRLRRRLNILTTGSSEDTLIPKRSPSGTWKPIEED